MTVREWEYWSAMIDYFGMIGDGCFATALVMELLSNFDSNCHIQNVMTMTEFKS